MDARTKEAIRYLGYGGHPIDERTWSMIQDSIQELERIADLKYTYGIFGIIREEVSCLRIGNMSIKSRSLAKSLKDCDEAIVFAITLGAETDRRLRKYELLDMAKAVVFQASATAFLEEQCKTAVEGIKREIEQSGLFLRPRFSPGYGDFSILHQKEILEMLEAQKRIGLTMTDSFMLAPAKSVTAVIGVSKTNENCHVNGCEICTKIDCLYRRN